MIATYIE